MMFDLPTDRYNRNLLSLRTECRDMRSMNETKCYFKLAPVYKSRCIIRASI